MAKWNQKRNWPLRKVVDREQVFRSTPDFPDGYINETLSCGHQHKDAVDSAFGSKTHRRCKECWQASPVHQLRAKVRRRIRRSINA